MWLSEIMRVGGGNPRSMCWNDEVKHAVKRKDAACKEALRARYEDAKEIILEV